MIFSILWSFGIAGNDGSKNVTFQMNTRFFQILSRLFLFSENISYR